VNILATREDIKTLINSKRKDIQSDNPQVEIAKLNHDAIKVLADQNNEIFSQLYKDTLQDETLDYALAINFAHNPLQALEERLKVRGIQEKRIIKHDLGDIEEEIDIRIKVPMFENFLKEFLIRRHCLNRKRVNEYIDALDKANGKETIFQGENKTQSILRRLG
jgi:hypothetical protein